MKFGPVRHLSCCHCGGSLNHRPLLQVDARFAELWSDGYVDSPMVPEQPLVASCGHCRQLVWLPELMAAADDSGACDYHSLPEPRLWQWLEQHGHTPSEHQLHVRTKLWQLANHRYRRGQQPVNWSERERLNMERLLGILDMNSLQERLIAAELLRQLGHFDDARQALQLPLEGMAAEVAELLRDQIEKREQRVFVCRLNPADGQGSEASAC